MPTMRTLQAGLIAVVAGAFMASPAAQAAVFKCEKGGKITYTDKPCAAGAQPANLPPLSTVEAGPQADLAAQHDARMAKERKANSQANAAYVKEHDQRKAREKRIQNAILAHQVLVGMTHSEVRSSLGVPDQESDAAWVYRRAGSQSTIRFGPDGVVSVSERPISAPKPR